MQADDADMAVDTERVQDLRQRLDLARQKIDSELDKGAVRDKELVAAYERRVEDLRKELEVLAGATTSNIVCEGLARNHVSKSIAKSHIS